MGFKIQSSNLYFPIFLSLLFFFLLLSFSRPVSSLLSPKLAPLGFRRSNVPAHYRTLYEKHSSSSPTTSFLSNQQEPVNSNNKREERNKKQRKKKINNGFKMNRETEATLSMMLPKGFVPPSGSSSCHNENPESVTFYCDLSDAQNP